MEISEREKGSISILDIQGEVDLYNAPDIKNMIQNLIDKQRYKVIINLEKVSYIDSSGIGALVASLSKLKMHEGGEMKIINLLASVERVFELTKLVSFFSIYDSEDEAVAAF